MQSCYQAAVWKCCLQARTQDKTFNPDGHGWKIEGAKLSIIWMTQPAAPDAILSLISCGCKSGCSPHKTICSCVKQGLPCTDTCKCIECENQVTNPIYLDDDTDTEE